ncbi:hypothetical protein CU044_4760 [Streptomyces sp. L-9-10]|nr:hypothetical protein CU044_4760 [Streptomyces sp. L-9-10]
MDRARADRDVDVVVGDNAGESLGDAPQFDCGGTAGRTAGRAAGRVDDALSLAGKE